MPKVLNRRSALSSLTFGALEKELRERRNRAAQLQVLHRKAAAKLDAIEQELSALGASVVTKGGRSFTGRRRPKNSMTLVEALQKLLDGKTLNVTRITSAVQEAGYTTHSPNFRTIVNQTLINNTSKFKKVGRGLYTTKK